MFRFSIREMMLFILVVGHSLGWGLDHFKLSESCDKLAEQSKGRGDFLSQLNVTISQSDIVEGEIFESSGSDFVALPDSPFKRDMERLESMSAAVHAAEAANAQAATSSSPSLRP